MKIYKVSDNNLIIALKPVAKQTFFAVSYSWDVFPILYIFLDTSYKLISH